MVVHADRMRENLDLTYGALFSQRVLLALVAGGLQRDDAYRIAQEHRAAGVGHAHAAARRCSRPSPSSASTSTTIFDLAHYTKHAPEIVGRLDALRLGGRSPRARPRASPGVGDLRRDERLDALGRRGARVGLLGAQRHADDDRGRRRAARRRSRTPSCSRGPARLACVPSAPSVAELANVDSTARPERAADLLRRVEQPGGEALVVGRDAAGRDQRQRHERVADAEREQQRGPGRKPAT